LVWLRPSDGVYARPLPGAQLRATADLRLSYRCPFGLYLSGSLLARRRLVAAFGGNAAHVMPFPIFTSSISAHPPLDPQ
jgi:hypothetical protein